MGDIVTAITGPKSGAAATGATRASRSFYRPELDAVRFVAFLFVYCHHTLPRYASAYPYPYPVAHVLAVLVDMTAMGLSLFFTLSAYLICELLLREKVRTGTVGIKRFYVRRMLRIWPLYFLGLAIGAVWAVHFGAFRLEWPWLLADSLMAGNIYVGLHGWGVIGTGPASPLWSISIEEQFYLVWPGAAKLLSERALTGLAWSIIAIANLTLIYLGFCHSSVDNVVWSNSLVQFYMFGAGILLALTLRGRMPSFSPAVRALLGAGSVGAWCIAAFVFHVRGRQPATVGDLVPGYALIAAGSVGIMLCFMGIRDVPRWLSYLGRLSYGLYVFHYFAIDEWGGIAAKLRIHNTGIIAFVAPLLGSLALAMLSYRYFEAPFRRLKDKEAVIHSQPPASLDE